jgi:plastocyanin
MRHALISTFIALGCVAGICAGPSQVQAQVYYSSYYYPAEPVYYSSYYTPVSYSTPVYYSYYSPYTSTVYCEPSYSSEQSYSSQQSYSNEQSYATQQPAESADSARPYAAARPAPASAATTVTVSVEDNRFAPQSITIQPGTTVRWVNYGQHSHTVSANNISWDSGDLKPGDSYLATFRKPGSYYYYCRHHTRDRMQGIVIVVDSASNGSSAETSGY